MRKPSLLLLVALLFDIFALHPYSVSIRFDGHSAVEALDVCHTQVNGLADHDDAPCMTGKAQASALRPPFQHFTIMVPLSIPPLFVTGREHPPKA